MWPDIAISIALIGPPIPAASHSSQVRTPANEEITRSIISKRQLNASPDLSLCAYPTMPPHVARAVVDTHGSRSVNWSGGLISMGLFQWQLNLNLAVDADAGEPAPLAHQTPQAPEPVYAAVIEAQAAHTADYAARPHISSGAGCNSECNSCNPANALHT